MGAKKLWAILAHGFHGPLLKCLYDEARKYGERAQQIAMSFPSDQYLYFKSLAGLGYLHWSVGELKETYETAGLLLEYGERTSNSRSNVLGNFFFAMCQMVDVDMDSAKKRSRQAIESSTDPLYVQFGRLCLGWAYLISGQFEDAEEVLQQVVDFSEERGEGQFLSWAHIFLGSTLIGLGSMKQGMKMLERAREAIDQHQRKGCQAFCEYALGKVYSLISTGPKPFFSVMAKNIGFLVKNLPFSDKKAVSHLNRTIEASRQIGARGGLGLACLDLGMFYKSKHETALAHECLTEAIKTFEGIGAENTLRQAKDALAALR